MIKIAFAGPWKGELGWEICTWQSHLRKLSHDYDRMIISTFPGMEALYQDFHCDVDFLPHQEKGRAQDWRDVDHVETGFEPAAYTSPIEYIKPIKQYMTDGEFVMYGTPREENRDIEILFHARAIPNITFKNWNPDKWAALASNFPKGASVGTMDDLHIPGTEDKRGIPLPALMDLMSGAKCVVGQSSGVMHLASMCGVRHVVWADNKTYFGKRLEVRYREDWNPLKTPVSWVETEAWDPEPDEVLKAIISGARDGRPTDQILGHLKKATESGKYMVAIVYLSDAGEQEKIVSFCETVEFPTDKMGAAIAQIKTDMQKVASDSNVEPEKGEEVLSIWH